MREIVCPEATFDVCSAGSHHRECECCQTLPPPGDKRFLHPPQEETRGTETDGTGSRISRTGLKAHFVTITHTHQKKSGRLLAASCQTAGVLLAETGLIDSLLLRAIKDLIEEKIGPIEEEHTKRKTEISSVCVYAGLQYLIKPPGGVRVTSQAGVKTASTPSRHVSASPDRLYRYICSDDEVRGQGSGGLEVRTHRSLDLFSCRRFELSPLE